MRGGEVVQPSSDKSNVGGSYKGIAICELCSIRKNSESTVLASDSLLKLEALRLKYHELFDKAESPPPVIRVFVELVEVMLR